MFLITFMFLQCPVVVTGRYPPDDLFLEVIYNLDVVLDMRGVGVVHQAHQVVVEHAVAGGEVVEVDELCGRPDEPLRQVEAAAQLQGLAGQAARAPLLQLARHHQTRRDAQRAEHHLQHLSCTNQKNPTPLLMYH